jgi:hypothetical protein
MADRGIPGNGLECMDSSLGRTADEHTLRSSVLIAKRDFQMEDLLTVTLETKMPGFNNPCMDRTDGHFVNLAPFDPVIIGDAHDGGLSWRPAPTIVARTVRTMKTNRLEPRVAVRTDAVLFGDFPFEQVELGAVSRQRRETVIDKSGLADSQQPAGAICQDSIQVDSSIGVRSVTEESGDTLAAGHAIQDGFLEGHPG